VLIVDSGEEVDECVLYGEANNVAGGMVCCEIPTQECPDLIVTGSHSCSCIETPRGYSCEVHVEATVTNTAPEVPVTDSFGVALLDGCIPGGGGPIVLPVTGPALDELNATGSTSVEFSYEFATTDPTPPCCEYTIWADFLDVIDESCHPAPNGEHNNLFVSTFCCEDTTPLCPDLVIDVTRSSCSCSWTPQKELVCTVNVYATVENIGTQTATHFYCKLESTEGGDQTLIASLAPGASRALHFSFTFTAPVGRPAPCPLDFEVMADSKEYVDECDEDNNLDSGSVCCQR
jgi:hypothetical protein